jgi:hypothetical protein
MVGVPRWKPIELFPCVQVPVAFRIIVKRPIQRFHALVTRGGAEKALLPNVGNEPFELGALDQRKHACERMKLFRNQSDASPMDMLMADGCH